VTPESPSSGSKVCEERKVLIVEDQTLVGMGLQAHLEEIGCVVIGQAANAAEALELFRAHQPEIVLMDIKLDGADGIELAKQLLAERRCAIVMVSAYSDGELITRAGAAGVFGYLIKPVTRDGLAAQIEIALNRSREQEKLVHENETLTQTLETRKLVEKAKGILMKRLTLDEQTAHRRLQLESQKRRISISEVAKKVIDSEKLLGE